MLKRTPLKRKGSINKISEKQKQKNVLKSERTKQMHLWLKSLWDKMPKNKKCSSCGCNIWGEFKTIYFDHLLEKSRYEELEFEEENIYFCCGDCHTLKGNGFPTENHKKAIDGARARFLE